MQVVQYLTAAEGEVLVPSPGVEAEPDPVLITEASADDSSGSSSSAANASSSGAPRGSAPATWKGCLLGRNALMHGLVVGLLERQPSAEACCRACQQWAPAGGCNVWNFCELAGGCTYASSGQLVTLRQGQCKHAVGCMSEIGSNVE